MIVIEPTIAADFVSSDSFKLASGEILFNLKQRYTIYGDLNEARDNAVLVYHALTGSARIGEWWHGIIGAGQALDTNRFAFVCANFIGSCYGSTNEIAALLTTGDMVRAQIRLLNHLGINRLKAVIGGSLGGQLALQTVIDFPDLAEKCVCIGACELSAMGLALNHLQRESVRQTNSVSLARQIAMLSYKSADYFAARHARRPNRSGEIPANSMESRFDIAGYLDYQGAKFVERFDANSYNLISKAMDLFEITDEDINKIKAETTLIGISSDWLFAAADVQTLAERLKAQYLEMISPDGHDAFLSDTAQMGELLSRILTTKNAPEKSLTSRYSQ